MEDVIHVVDYDPAWPGRFAAEKSAILEALGRPGLAVEHVGSTAVPGLAAKDTIDLMIDLEPGAAGPDVVAAMKRLSYQDLGEYGLPGRRFFRKGLPPTHHVHMVRKDADFWTKQIVFRDFLRAHPDWCREYEKVKREKAARFEHERAAYTAAKTDFILGLQELAWRWAGADLVVYDLEATCWDHGHAPERQETIEIGAVRLGADLEPRDEFRTLIRPKDEPRLSAFCTKLTGIVQSDVDDAPPFRDALKSFASWLGGGLFRLASWSRYDAEQFRRDCVRRGLPLPPQLERQLDLRDLYARRRKIHPCPLVEALKREGMTFEGRQHGALVDARNAARLARLLLV